MPKKIAATLLASTLATGTAALAEPAPGLTLGRPEIRSMSALAFGPGGVLFVGDGKSGAVFALDLGDSTPRELKEPKDAVDVEAKLAALLGAAPADVMVHDLAVNPISKNAYLAVSRGRAAWTDRWLRPNDVADAAVLVKVDPEGSFSAVELSSLPFARVALPNPVDPAKTHGWKKVPLRADTITDLAFADGTLWIAGLSNEEFAATMWRAKFPFEGTASATTLENYHGAHGKYETEAPVRTFLPYTLGGKPQLVAAYLCTPLVTFPLADLQAQKHVRGRTVGEFGAGNYPLDIVAYKKAGKEKLLIANSNLPLMIVDPRDIESYAGEIAAKVPGYLGGVAFEFRSGPFVQQLDNLGETHVLALQRQHSGRLDLTPLPAARF